MADDDEPEGRSETAGTFGPAVLADRFLIDPAVHLPDYDSPSARAYAVEDRRDSSRQLFALVCTPGLPARVRLMAQLKGAAIRGLLPLVEWGAIHWPPSGQHCMVAVFERPKGGRVVPLDAAKIARINEYDLPRRVIEPILVALQDLNSRGSAVHRAIRPTNLFYLDESRQEIVLGECVTAPPGFDQPVISEVIERGMANPAGRGDGTMADDLYALGVTLVFLLLGYSPVGDMTEEEILIAKVEQGSYASICGNARVPLSMLEPLRGMLSDDPRERWGIEALDLWINGRQMTPIQKRAAQKADAPFAFGGHNHVTTRTLARSFSRNVREAAKVVRTEHFENWIRRNMQMPTLGDMIGNLLKEAEQQKQLPAGSDEVVIAKVCMQLDPAGPIRYKALSFMPDGFGSMIAVELLRQGNNQMSGEVLARDLPGFWLTQQGAFYPEYAVWERNFTQLKGFLKINDVGYGIERCLYELNPEMPCQSAILLKHYVATIRDLLPALDEAAKTADLKTNPMDRHIGAFIAARFNENIDPHLRALADSKEETFLIGMLSLLAFLQWRLRIEPMYGLSSWIGGLLGPAINTYHSRTTRREIEKEIPKLVRQGSLPDLFDLIDNPEKRRLDINAFNVACQQFAEAEAEVEKIENSEAANAESMERVGQQAAAMTSVVITMIVVAILFIVQYL
ncbi:MAG: hypothetical protein H7841_12170 [Magnetospirillum sp. WYHS-4]